jgi:hypothetical protein
MTPSARQTLHRSSQEYGAVRSLWCIARSDWFGDCCGEGRRKRREGLEDLVHVPE